jgi:hypothetical protein
LKYSLAKEGVCSVAAISINGNSHRDTASWIDLEDYTKGVQVNKKKENSFNKSKHYRQIKEKRKNWSIIKIFVK